MGCVLELGDGLKLLELGQHTGLGVLGEFVELVVHQLVEGGEDWLEGELVLECADVEHSAEKGVDLFLLLASYYYLLHFLLIPLLRQLLLLKHNFGLYHAVFFPNQLPNQYSKHIVLQ